MAEVAALEAKVARLDAFPVQRAAIHGAVDGLAGAYGEAAAAVEAEDLPAFLLAVSGKVGVCQKRLSRAVQALHAGVFDRERGTAAFAC